MNDVHQKSVVHIYCNPRIFCIDKKLYNSSRTNRMTKISTIEKYIYRVEHKLASLRFFFVFVFLLFCVFSLFLFFSCFVRLFVYFKRETWKMYSFVVNHANNKNNPWSLISLNLSQGKSKQSFQVTL